MAGVQTEIKIDVDYTGHREARKAIRDFSNLDRVVKKSAATFASASGGGSGGSAGGGVTKYWGRLRKSVTEFDKAVSMVAKVGLKGLSLAMKGSVIEMGLMAVAMLGVHAAFVVGNAAMKAMRALQGPLAAGMAAIVAAASAAAAAIRENQAAMYAYKTTSKKEFGSTLNQTRQVMRALHTDTYLATAGVETLNKAFAAVSKNSTFTMKSQKTLKGLMDFASAGQPLDQGVQKAGELIAALQNVKTTWSETKIAAEALFPDKQAMEKAMKKLKITTKKGLQKAIDTGSLAKEAGVEGQFEQVSGTLINKLKGYFTILRNQFADLGQPMLEPLKHAAEEVFRILRRGFVKISSSTRSFGMGNMLHGLVTLVQKATDKIVSFINNNTHTVEGMFTKLGNWWDRFRDGFDVITDKLRPLISGAKVIEGFFYEIFQHVKNIFNSKFGDFNEFLTKNEGAIKELGGGIGLLLENISAAMGEFTKLQQKLLPFVNDLVKGLAQIAGQITTVMKALNKMGSGPLGALGVILAMRGGMRGMQSMYAQGGYKMVMVNGKQQMVPSGPGGPGGPGGGPGGGPTVVHGPPTGGLGTTHATPPTIPTIPIPPIPTPTGTTPPTTPRTPTTPTTPPGTPAFPSSSRTPLQRPEYEVFKRAPKGGTYIGGKFYKGGSFLPTSQITAPERSYYGIEDIARPGSMSPMADVATDVGMVSMRAGTPVAPAAAAASASAGLASASSPTFSSGSVPLNRAGKPMAPPGGIEYNGRFYRQGQQLPDGFASSSGGSPTGPTPPSGGGGGGGGGATPPGGTGPTPPTPRRTRRFINNLQRPGTTGGTFIKGLKKIMDGPDQMWLPGAGGGEGEMRDVAGMTDEEFRQARVYNKAFGEGAYKDGKLPSSGGSGELTRRAKFRQRAIKNRTKMDGYRGRRNRAMLGSNTAKMGASFVLGAGSQFASEEAQGAMAAGAAVAQSNPLAGVAVAGLGTAMNARTVKGGGVSGALGGAAAGAMIGSAIPGIGTAVGAVVGTLVGGIGGMVMGYLNREKIKAQKAKAVAEKQINSIINTSLSSTLGAVQSESKNGGRDAQGKEIGPSSLRTAFEDPMKVIRAQQELLKVGTGSGVYDANGIMKSPDEVAEILSTKGGVTFSDEDKKNIAAKPEEYLNKLRKDGAANLAAMGPLQDKFNARMDALKTMTGKTDQEIMDMAGSLGINLYDATVDFKDVVEGLGVAMEKTKEQMNAVTVSAVVDSFSIFDDAIKKWDTPRILDEMARTFRDKANSGTLTFKDKAEFLQGVGEQNTTLFGSGGIAQAQFEESFQAGGSAFKKGGALYGMDPETFSGDKEIQALLDQQRTKARTDLGQQYADQLNSQLKGTGKMVDANAVIDKVMNMSTDELAALDIKAQGKFDTSKVRGAKSKESAVLGVAGMSDLELISTSKGKKGGKGDTSALDTAALGISDAASELIGSMDEFFKRDKENKPDWFTKEAFKELIDSDDTSTPRGAGIGDTTSSKLAITMGRHSAMDASLTGKRTVTSSYRTTGLGSVNSDHVTGRAYDLVGQNLGQYQTLAKAGGGFAEFHGTNASRHLHVVPGPGAIGDTRVPVASSNKRPSMGMSSTSGDTNYSFYIQGGKNASPQEIADQVMMKIKDTERSNRERR